MLALDDWSEPYRQRVAKLGAAVGIPPDELPLFGDPARNDLSHDQRHWISRLDNGYRLLWFERGGALFERDFSQVEEAIYQFFVEYTGMMAWKQAESGNPSHRDKLSASNEIQLQLLSRASEQWAARRERELRLKIPAPPYRYPNLLANVPRYPPHPFARTPYYYISEQVQDVKGESLDLRRSMAKPIDE
jgi:hypothetical protein